MKPVAFTPGAIDDAEVAEVWYDEQRAGLGLEFSDALRRAIVSLEPAERHARIGSLDGLPVRRAPLERPFRHRVLFVEEPDRLLVVAVAQPSQRPTYWRRR